MSNQYYKRPIEDRYWEKVDKSDLNGCWPWTAGRDKKMGYGQFFGTKPGQIAHRIGWELAFGPIPKGLCVCHSCDNPPCQNPSHWFLGTHKENTADMMAKGRMDGVSIHPEWRARGERNGLAKLSENAVREIREKYATGRFSQFQLGQEYGVNQTKISLVIRRKTWQHVL